MTIGGTIGGWRPEIGKGAFLRLRASWHVSTRARVLQNYYPKSPPAQWPTGPLHRGDS